MPKAYAGGFGPGQVFGTGQNLPFLIAHSVDLIQPLLLVTTCTIGKKYNTIIVYYDSSFREEEISSVNSRK